MNWRINLICGAIIFTLFGCSEDSVNVTGTSTEPNTLANASSSSLSDITSSSEEMSSSSDNTHSPILCKAHFGQPCGGVTEGDLWTFLDEENANTDVYADSTWPSNAIADGKWYWITDSAYGGKTSIKWPIDPGDAQDKESLIPIIEQCNGLCGRILFDKGNSDYDPFVNLGFGIAKDSAGNRLAVDVSNWNGICIAYSSSISIKLELDLGDSLTDLLQHDTPRKQLPKSVDGTEKCVPWSEFEREGWGPKIDGWDDNEIIGEKAAQQLVGIIIILQGMDNLEGNFNIAGLGTYRD